MKTYLKELDAFLASDSISFSDADFDAVRDGEKIVGVCSENTKRMIAFLIKLSEDLGDREACMEATDEKKDPLGYARWEGESRALLQKIHTTANLLWVTVYEESPELCTVQNLGIRKGWKIISSPGKISVEKVIGSVLKIIARRNGGDICQGKN